MCILDCKSTKKRMRACASNAYACAYWIARVQKNACATTHTNTHTQNTLANTRLKNTRFNILAHAFACVAYVYAWFAYVLRAKKKH